MYRARANARVTRGGVAEKEKPLPTVPWGSGSRLSGEVEAVDIDAATVEVERKKMPLPTARPVALHGAPFRRGNFIDAAVAK